LIFLNANSFVFTLISALLFMFYIFLIFFIFSRKERSILHILFAVMSFFLSIWFFSGIFLYSTRDIQKAQRYIQFGSIGIILFIPMILHFTLVFTKKLKRWKYFYIYIPFFIIVIHNFYEPLFFSNIFFRNNSLYFIPNIKSIWHISYSTIGLFYIFVSIFLLLRFYFKSTKKKDKKISKILAFSLFSWIFIIALEEIFLPIFFFKQTLALGPITFIIYMIGEAYAIVKYDFMDNPVLLASYDILENIDESIILLDNSLKIITINKITEEMLGIKREKIKNIFFPSLTEFENDITKKIASLIENKKENLLIILTFFLKGKRIAVKTRISLIRDRLDDPLAVLIIGKEIQKDNFIERYKISKSEFKIIIEFLSGLTNKEIGEKLSISELTVKSHFTHIYNKLGINNKIKLLKILGKFEIVP